MQDQTMNGMSSVITTITNVGSRNYRLNSVATRPGGHNSEVETYINCLNFVNLLEGAITSLNDVELHNTNVTGQIYYGDDYQATGSDIIPTANNPLQREITNWPTWDDLSPLYLADVQGHEVTYSSWYLNQHTPCEIGPIYKDGSLTIDCNTSGLTLKLMGTLYVTGNLSFAQSKNYTIDLNGQTMFVHGTGTGDAISMASNSITLKGSGCIIADGNIQFKPGMDAGNEDEYVLVMSLTGKTYMQPNGTFYGSLVGDSEVEIQNGTLTWTDPTNHDLNFPGNEIGATVPVDGAGTVVSYIIK